MTDQLDRLTDITEDWLDRFMASKWLRGFCWGIIAVSIMYFGPVLIGILIR